MKSLLVMCAFVSSLFVTSQAHAGAMKMLVPATVTLEAYTYVGDNVYDGLFRSKPAQISSITATPCTAEAGWNGTFYGRSILLSKPNDHKADVSVEVLIDASSVGAGYQALTVMKHNTSTCTLNGEVYQYATAVAADRKGNPKPLADTDPRWAVIDTAPANAANWQNANRAWSLYNAWCGSASDTCSSDCSQTDVGLKPSKCRAVWGYAQSSSCSATDTSLC